jgi:opacity protein-like surface antigen
MMSRTILASLSASVLAIGIAAPAFAQQPPPPGQQPTLARSGLLGFIGGVSGGGGTTFGGGMQFVVKPRLLVVAELGYLTGGQDFQGFGVDVDLHAISVDTNAHYLFPLSDSPRFIPYALGGLGFLRASSSVSGGGFSADASSNTIGLNVGGGALLQLGPKWALRPELKIFMADGSNVRFSAGMSYGFGS